MVRTTIILVATLAALGCRVQKERVGGRTRLDIRGEHVQVSTVRKTVKVGSESTQVPVPQVHISGDSARAQDSAAARPAVPPPR